MTVTPVPYLSCEWPVDPACFTEDWDALDEPTQDRCRALASATLRRLTGYRVGGCPVTVRPCKQGCVHGAPYLSGYGRWWPSAMWPTISGSGDWVNSCGCYTDCSCTALAMVAAMELIWSIVLAIEPIASTAWPVASCTFWIWLEI